MPQWTHEIVDTRSGTRLTNVDVAAWDYQTVANGVGQGRADIVLRGSGIDQATWDDLLRGRARTIVHSLDGFAMYAGVIDGDDWDPESGVTSVRSSEVRSFASKRHPFMVPTFTNGWSTAITGKSLRGIVRRIVEVGFHATPGDNWHLPIVLGSEESGSQSRGWEWHSFPLIEDMLREIQDTDNGPDIYFDPIWSSAGKLEWWLKTGSPALSGTSFESRAVGGNLASVTVSTDSSKQLTGVFGIGEGSEADMVVGTSPALGIAGPQVPNMDASQSWKKVDSTSQLNGLATGYLRERRAANRTWSFDVVMDGSFAPHELRPGSTFRIWHDGDERVAAGWRDEYVLSVAGGASDRMRVGFRNE